MGIDFSCLFGSLFSSSWKGRWPPSAVNSNKLRGRAFSTQVRVFVTDSGSNLSSCWELVRTLLVTFLGGVGSTSCI